MMISEMLIGTWIVDTTDIRALSELGNVVLEFATNGQLRYVVKGKMGDQIILMEYAQEEGVIVTNQRSAPRVERTSYSISDDGTLTLEFDGVPYRFVRA